MFIPRGKPIHENLATSYVLLDSLVADLCEGGFSGVVEVVLLNTDSYVVIVGGNVAGVIEHSGEHNHTGNEITYARTTVAQLADRSRTERGRVSIYGYTASTARAVGGRINAHALYSGLSTEFTDLEKMISKLSRERDREWFIEIRDDNAPRALIHMSDNLCNVLTSTEAEPKEQSCAVDQAGNSELGRLLQECNRGDATFDVYSKSTAEAAKLQTDNSPFEPVLLSRSAAETSGNAERGERGPSGSLASAQPFSGSDLEGPLYPEVANPTRDEDPVTMRASAALSQPLTALPVRPARFPADGHASASLDDEPGDSRIRDLPLTSEGLAVSSDDEVMAEVKRLMGEIARSIEQAAQQVGRPDSFSMSLRASQLKIAGRYPFLDPFAGDFEYLGGEIVFVGRATAKEFTVALTQALKLALQAVTQETAYADRFRAYVTEDLQKLLSRSRAEFESYGLDEVIMQIIGF